MLGVHPVLAPQQYVGRTIEVHDDHVRLRLGRDGGIDVDGGWTTFIDADHLAPLDALVRGVDPHFSTRIVEESPDALVVDVIRDETPARESKDVQVTRFSSGAAFVFADRGIPLPLTVL